MFLENSKTVAIDFIKVGQSISLALPLLLYVEALDCFLYMSCDEFLLVCLYFEIASCITDWHPTGYRLCSEISNIQNHD